MSSDQFTPGFSCACLSCNQGGCKSHSPGFAQSIARRKAIQRGHQFFFNEFHVNADTPPTLLLHAADEKLVDIKNSILFFEALEQGGIPVEAQFFAKRDHGFFSFRVIGGNNPSWNGLRRMIGLKN